MALRAHIGAVALLLTAGLSCCPVLSAQQSPAVEVLTLKRLPRAGQTPGGIHTLGDIVELPGDTLLEMIEIAFSVSPYQIIGAPRWARAVPYKLVFKLPRGHVVGLAGFRQSQRMLRAALVSRFHFKFHRETGQEAARVLTIGTHGARLQRFRSHTGRLEWEGIVVKPGLLAFSAIPMDQLAFIMSLSLGQTVVDQSGLHGRYDCEAHWLPSGTPLHPNHVTFRRGAVPSYDRSESDSASLSPTQVSTTPAPSR